MDLSGLTNLLRQHPLYRQVVDDLDHSQQPSAGIMAAAQPFFLAALSGDIHRSILVVTSRVDRAYRLLEELPVWNPDLRVSLLDEPAPLFYERAPWGDTALSSRTRVLSSLTRTENQPDIVIASARAIMQRTISRDLWADRRQVITKGGMLPEPTVNAQLHHWLSMGYEPASVVVEPGTFSRRGGILDIFPHDSDHPVRIELWGEDVESIRRFDPATQLSLDNLQKIAITPAREALPSFGPEIAAHLHKWLDQPDHPAAESMMADLEALSQGRAFPNLEFYLPWMTPDPVSALSYLPDDALIVVEDVEDLAETVAEFEAQALELRETYQRAGDIPPDMPLPLVTWAQLNDEMSAYHLLQMKGHPADDQPALGDHFSPGPRYGGELKRMLSEIREETRGQHHRVVIVSRQAQRLAELWREHTLNGMGTLLDGLPTLPDPGPPIFVQGSLGDGWLLRGDEVDTHLYTDAEIFGWQRPEARRRTVTRSASPEDFFADLAPGDYVVHIEYGIGHFEGLEKRQLKGIDREFLLLRYGGGDVLYVPIYQADRLSRYVGPDDSPPKLSRLGGTEWERVKERVRANAEEMARDLLELYATRETVQGHSFGTDSAWQQELEASFPYVETPDQLQALAEVKADMERPTPMDRLICGDVGYGKTEVALRAAFKSVMDGKQVAVLVPTTVLAQQHFETFSQRLAPFPMQVEMLSRFRTRTEQDAIVARLASGTIDIVIGTHRLLGSDVEFADLGLLIIDEEQRFGVTHKEHFKQLRTEIDVLTMTATPIPRTLYMSLTGVRDISVIDTPPAERLPVATYVGRRDEDLIRQAVLREIDRGGQIFYVHNRVQSIFAEAARLRRIVPEAKIAVGHGQMSEHDLESVMADFASGEVNMLVSTSIIEAGLDIPNANTLIVDRADRFGLSQLYQLRGRVGRSANRAYAYFFHPATSRMTSEARARLDAIGAYTDLGSGRDVAMRDLEIRGAGEILGARQHGQISSVGFHLYTRMLGQAVQRLKAEREGSFAQNSESLDPDLSETVTIDLPVPTYIPTEYVPDLGLRIQLYRRMADIHSPEDIAVFSAELTDRFGPLPPPVENLLIQLEVKVLALRAQVAAVVTDSGQISIRRAGLDQLDRRSLQQQLGYNVRVSRTAIWLAREDEDWLNTLRAVLTTLAEITTGAVMQTPA